MRAFSFKFIQFIVSQFIVSCVLWECLVYSTLRIVSCKTLSGISLNVLRAWIVLKKHLLRWVVRCGSRGVTRGGAHGARAPLFAAQDCTKRVHGDPAEYPFLRFHITTPA